MPHPQKALSEADSPGIEKSLLVLSPRQVRLIDQALSALGPFGEVRLVKQKGKLRFIASLESKEIPEDTP